MTVSWLSSETHRDITIKIAVLIAEMMIMTKVLMKHWRKIEQHYNRKFIFIYFKTEELHNFEFKQLEQNICYAKQHRPHMKPRMGYRLHVSSKIFWTSVAYVCFIL